MYKYSLFLYILLTSCSQVDIKAGVSLTNDKWGEPEITGLNSPLGIIRGEYETERGNTAFCEHISSLSESEKGGGLNHCGFLFKL